MISKTLFLAGAFMFGAGERAFLIAQGATGGATGGASGGWEEAGKFGLVGIVLIFVLYRLEPRMKGIETAVNFLTQMIRLMLIEIKETSPGVRAQAISIGEQMKATNPPET